MLGLLALIFRQMLLDLALAMMRFVDLIRAEPALSWNTGSNFYRYIAYCSAASAVRLRP